MPTAPLRTHCITSLSLRAHCGQQVEDANVIVTTPEKWDVVTRKGGDGALVAAVGLLLIDEVRRVWRVCLQHRVLSINTTELYLYYLL